MTRPAHYKLAERDELTARQRQVLELVARGLTNAEIAEHLDLSLDGVKWHVREILGRLGVDSREEAADWWRTHNAWRSRARRAMSGVVPASVAVRAVAGGAFAAAVAGSGALLVLSLGGGGDNAIGAEPDDSMSATHAVVQPTPTPAKRVVIVSPGECDARDFSTRSDERVEGDKVVLELTVTKPQTCNVTKTYEAFVVGPNGLPDGKRMASDAAEVRAAIGTDEIRLRVEWSNWCSDRPAPTPDVPPLAEGWGNNPPLWVADSPDTATGSRGNYPPCQDANSPTVISITATVRPDPPVLVEASSPAPPVASAADLPAFARWFAKVVAARDTETLRAHSVALTHTCQGSGNPQSLCQDQPAGRDVVGFIMDSAGHLGSDAGFFGQLNFATLSSNTAMASAGCVVVATQCQQFVVAFDTLPAPGGGPRLGNYQAFVFEVLQGKPALRGYYPGGIDRDAVIVGGVAMTPLGDVLFAPVLP